MINLLFPDMTCELEFLETTGLINNLCIRINATRSEVASEDQLEFQRI